MSSGKCSLSTEFYGRVANLLKAKIFSDEHSKNVIKFLLKIKKEVGSMFLLLSSFIMFQLGFLVSLVH